MYDDDYYICKAALCLAETEGMTSAELNDYNRKSPSYELDFYEQEMLPYKGGDMKKFINQQEAWENFIKFQPRFEQVAKSEDLEESQILMAEYNEELSECEKECKRFFFPVVRKDDDEEARNILIMFKENRTSVAKLVNMAVYSKILREYTESLTKSEDINDFNKSVSEVKTELAEKACKGGEWQYMPREIKNSISRLIAIETLRYNNAA